VAAVRGRTLGPSGAPRPCRQNGAELGDVVPAEDGRLYGVDEIAVVARLLDTSQIWQIATGRRLGI